MENWLDYLRQLNMTSMMLRIILALLMGGLIGMERERKRRPAGFRTYMLVALGAALTDAEWQWALCALAGTALLTLPARLLDRRENPWFPRIISIEKKENVP